MCLLLISQPLHFYAFFVLYAVFYNYKAQSCVIQNILTLGFRNENLHQLRPFTTEGRKYGRIYPKS